MGIAFVLLLFDCVSVRLMSDASVQLVYGFVAVPQSWLFLAEHSVLQVGTSWTS